MNNDTPSKLLRIGIFYDGNYFVHVSNYYKYGHKRKARISIPGLHEFVRHHVATLEGTDVRFCQIVDSHFFRGRFSAKSAEEHQQLYYDRVFDDILMGEGVVTHFLPMRANEEKGVDVWLALEAFELAVYKRFDVLVLIAGDGDFVPLARKVNSLGTRMMILGWDFSYIDSRGEPKDTITSIHLLDEVTYPVLMNTIIDDKTKRDDALIKALFVDPRPPAAPVLAPAPANQPVAIAPAAVPLTVEARRYEGELCVLKEGFGFIRSVAFPKNIFFFWDQLKDADFNGLKVGEKVTFAEGKNDRGSVAIAIEKV